MDNQSAFDKMCFHLMKQFEKSINHPRSGNCAYRSYGGLKCAVGALIPDELYNKRMDEYGGLSANKLIDKFPKLKPVLGDVSPLLLDNVQICHDNYEPSQWYEYLRHLAEYYKLSTAVLESAAHDFGRI